MRISDWSSDVCSSDLEFQASMERKGRRYARRRAMLEWTDRASVHDALVEGIKSVAKSQSIDFDHIAITGLSDGASTATYALIHSRIFSLALLSSCCEDPDVLETDVGEAYISHIRKNDNQIGQASCRERVCPYV